MSERPNIVIMMIEQFSAFVDPHYVDCPVDTPALDRLAERAIRYHRAYCNAPVCGPSRLSFLTGRHACNIDAFDNGSELPGHVPTVGHVLTQAGYRTAICGRMHIHGMDQHRGFEQRLCSEIINPLPCTPGDHPGELCPLTPLPPAPDLEYSPTFSDSPIYRHDAYVTDQACAFLQAQDRESSSSPFCLTIGWFAAHTGFKPCPELGSLYDKYIRRDDLPIRPFTQAEFDRLPEHARRQHQYLGNDQRVFLETYQRHEMAWYLARVEYADRQVGRVLAALKQAGLEENTAVIVTADHGENMGRHGLWGKMNFYEEAMRIPLYLALPASQAGDGRCERQAVSLIDILPTVADLAAYEVTTPLDGRSLLDLEPDEEERTIFAEYHGYQAPASMYMALRGSAKYCHYLKEPDEFYDRDTDPYEEHDRSDDPDCADIRQSLLTEIHARVEPQHLESRIAAYNAQRDAVYQALVENETHAGRIRRHIQQFREALDEPWWDGGAYMAKYQAPALNSATRGR